MIYIKDLFNFQKNIFYNFCLELLCMHECMSILKIIYVYMYTLYIYIYIYTYIYIYIYNIYIYI